MEIIDVSDQIDANEFGIKKFIDAGNKYYAVIQPYGANYKIEISASDYHKALRAYYRSKSISCYPIDGNLVGDTFENATYEIDIF